MAITVETTSALAPEQASGVTYLTPEQIGPLTRADITAIDGCPVLRRLKVFLVEQGTVKTLEWTLRDSRGQPRNLVVESDASSASDSASLSSSEIELFWQVNLRVRQALALGPPSDARTLLYEIPGTIVDAENGVVRVGLPTDVTEVPGIYELSWGILDENNNLLFVDQAFMSVERNLYSAVTIATGAPTIQEIRLSIRDSDPGENLLLDDVEFDGAELVQAIVRPVAYWNEVPPPIEKFRPDTFPYREHWLKAIQGYLFQMAAHSYRRNTLKYDAGGNSVADKDKEREYLAMSERLLGEYQTWVLNTKVSLNIRKFYGTVGSTYGRMI